MTWLRSLLDKFLSLFRRKTPPPDEPTVDLIARLLESKARMEREGGLSADEFLSDVVGPPAPMPTAEEIKRVVEGKKPKGPAFTPKAKRIVMFPKHFGTFSPVKPFKKPRGSR